MGIDIKMKEKIKGLIVQFVKFGVVGVSNTLISLLVYYIFLFINSDLYLIGNAVGFTVSTFNAYFWNNRFVFKKGKKEKNITVIVKTYLSYGFSFFVSEGLMYLLVEILNVSKRIAPIAILFVTIPLNFLLNNYGYTEKAKEKRKVRSIPNENALYGRSVL